MYVLSMTLHAHFKRQRISRPLVACPLQPTYGPLISDKDAKMASPEADANFFAYDQQNIDACLAAWFASLSLQLNWDEPNACSPTSIYSGASSIFPLCSRIVRCCRLVLHREPATFCGHAYRPPAMTIYAQSCPPRDNALRLLLNF